MTTFFVIISETGKIASLDYEIEHHGVWGEDFSDVQFTIGFCGSTMATFKNRIDAEDFLAGKCQHGSIDSPKWARDFTKEKAVLCSIKELTI